MIQVKSLLAVLMVAVFGVGLVACGSDSDSDKESAPEETKQADGGQGSGELEGVAWTLMNVGSSDGWATSIPNDVEAPTLEIADGQAQVFTGCNTISSKVEIAPKTIVFESGPMTQKSCEQVQNQLEHLVTQVIPGKTTYEINDDGNLVLKKKGTSLVFTTG